MTTIQATYQGFGKLQGLAFRKKMFPVFFKTRFGIHTYFVKEPIDIVILDDFNVIKKVYIGMKPWRIFVWDPQYTGVLEMPKGTIERLQFKVGQKIRLIFV